MKKPSKRIRQTLSAFDRKTILTAYKEHIKGNGGNTVGQHYAPWAPSSLSHGDLTVIGDRLIDAGRWICETEGLDIHEVYCPDMVYFQDYTINFHGSWGEIKVFAETGEVISVEPELETKYGGVDSFCGYHEIKKVDIEEFKKWLSKVPTKDGTALRIGPYFGWDILDVGYWTIWGEYVPAEEDHRKLIIELIEEEIY